MLLYSYMQLRKFSLSKRTQCPGALARSLTEFRILFSVQVMCGSCVFS